MRRKSGRGNANAPIGEHSPQSVASFAVRHTRPSSPAMPLLELLVQILIDWARSTVVEVLSRGAAEFFTSSRKRKNRWRPSKKRSR